ncbi:MAG: sulfite exporter TauE/SafE family protein [Bacteroidota bacterium]
MNIEIILSALMLGLLGSFHCAGMCGPIALAIPLNNQSWFSKINGSLIYNIGRAITYAIMGGIFGLLGKGLVLAGFQKWVSIIMGGIMVTSVLFPSLYKNRFDLDKSAFSFVGNLKIKLGNLLRKRSYGSLLLIGLLNGLLPCGLVYIAIAGAIATTGSLSGAMFMFIFGLGTLPMLFAISILGNISVKLRSKMTKIIPVVVFFIGVLFIIRGLGLGIPYLSPPEKKLQVPDKMEMKMKG